VFGAILQPCSVSTLQIGSTPNLTLCASMNATTSSVGGRAPLRRMRCRCQDLVRPSQLFHLTLELAHPRPLVTREPRPLTAIHLGLADPQPQRLVVEVQLLRDRLDRFPLRRVLVLMIEDHPHRPLAHLGRIRADPLRF
jgi:hypothetical protein